MSRVPRIRFKGFEEDWEQRKLSDLYEKVIEKNDLSFGTDKIISVASMYYKEDTSNSDDDYMRTYNVMRLGDIAFEGNKSKNFAHGRFVENTIGDGIVSHVFDVFRPISEYDLLFWKYFINYEGVMGRIMIRCTKSSTMMTNLVAKDFLEESIVVPSIVEQKRIGYYLKSIDHLITLHQRKLEKLKIIKKSMLENLFPQNEEKTPKIRFLGFTKDWEQRKLGEIAEYKKGPFGSALRKDIFVQKGKDTVKIYEQQNAICKDCKLERYFVTKEYANKLTGFEVHGGDIIVSCAGTIGEIYEIPYDAEMGIINQALMRIKVYQKVVDKGIFIILFSKLIDKFSIVHSNGSAIKNIPAFSDLKPTIVFVPSIAEQKKIRKCFESIDHLITLHQSKLEKLQKIKKSMLESMFV